MFVTPATKVQVPELKLVIVSSFEPSRIIVFGSRSGASFADSIARPVTATAPMDGVTTKPEGLALFAESKFRYFAWVLSMALATPSDPGLFEEEGMIGS